MTIDTKPQGEPSAMALTMQQAKREVLTADKTKPQGEPVAIDFLSIARKNAFEHAPDHDYLPSTMDEAVNWKPHDWVLSAMLEVERKILAAAKDRLRTAESDRLAALESQLAEARAEVERLRVNAERYLWLRGDVPHHSARWSRWRIEHWAHTATWNDLRGNDLDAAIDAARSQP